MARILADEHVPSELQNELRSLGHTVLFARSLSEKKSGDGTPDDSILEFARQHRMRIKSLAGRMDGQLIHISLATLRKPKRKKR